MLWKYKLYSTYSYYVPVLFHGRSHRGTEGAISPFILLYKRKIYNYHFYNFLNLHKKLLYCKTYLKGLFGRIYKKLYQIIFLTNLEGISDYPWGLNCTKFSYKPYLTRRVSLHLYKDFKNFPSSFPNLTLAFISKEVEFYLFSISWVSGFGEDFNKNNSGGFRGQHSQIHFWVARLAFRKKTHTVHQWFFWTFRSKSFLPDCYSLVVSRSILKLFPESSYL